MVAYELRRLWQDVKVTIEEGIEELSSLCATEAVIGKMFRFRRFRNQEKVASCFSKKAYITLLDAIFCRNVNVFAIKKLVEERRNSLKTNS
jgi:hypothetical protein